jgi:signal transduction histidine kinase
MSGRSRQGAFSRAHAGRSGPWKSCEQQAHLFGRFVQADNARAYGIAGTGLGLYLCRELVERHGGQLWCESVEGQGSTFFMRLPIASPAAPARF